MDQTVLCYIENNEQYLMLFRNKKLNDINEGKWIGIGGHLEEKETKEEALLREVKEETNLTLKSFVCRGEILFSTGDIKETMYLYTSNEYEGEIRECDEGELKWIPFTQIMSLNLWEGDRIFLPKLMNSKEFIKLELYYEKDKLVKVVEKEENNL